MFSIVLLALLAHSSKAVTDNNTMGQQDFDRLYRAAVDIAMTCYGDPGNAIGVVGDMDGSILKALRLNHLFPVVLVNGSRPHLRNCDDREAHKLRVFVIPIYSAIQFGDLIIELHNYIWWDNNANFLIVDKRPELSEQCTQIERFIFGTTFTGMLSVQFICHNYRQGKNPIAIYTANPFIKRAPKAWRFLKEYSLKTSPDKPNGYLFDRLYREGGKTCESFTFPRAHKVGGYPLRFLTDMTAEELQHDSNVTKALRKNLGDMEKKIAEWVTDDHRWLIDNIVRAMNVTAVITEKYIPMEPGIFLEAHWFSTYATDWDLTNGMIVRLDRVPIVAVTQHTPHMSQLDKILSVIDRKSRIGMCLVYVITFLFFKFFLGQAVIPSLLDLMRLTCNTGLTRLPQTVSSTCYLTALFMFVVTLQGIYTGNLSTLLTTTIPYPNVQKKEDIPKLGYKLYIIEGSLSTLTGDPSLDGCIVEIPRNEQCIEYVSRDRLAACAMDYSLAIVRAKARSLHMAQEPIKYESIYYSNTMPNMFHHRIEEILWTLFETGLTHSDLLLESLRLELVDDDEVKKNTVRRVMTLDDLGFAFVILGVGLLCSSVCFMAEILVCKIHSKIAKKRERVHVRAASVT